MYWGIKEYQEYGIFNSLIRGMRIKEDLTMNFENPIKFKIHLASTPDDLDYTKSVLTYGFSVEDDIYDIFEGIKNKKYYYKSIFDKETPPPEKRGVPHWKDVPKFFKSKIKALVNRLYQAERNSLDLLLWRTDQGISHQPYSGGHDQFSFDGKEWFSLPMDLSGVIRSTSSKTKFPEGIDNFIEENFKKEACMPTHYSFFREALGQYDENPRSSLVIGLATIEYAAIWASKLLPTSDKYKKEIGIERYGFPDIMKKFIPHFSDIAEKKLPEEEFFNRNEILSINESRIDIVHGRGKNLNPEEAWIALCKIKRVISYIEYLAGFDWAVEHKNLGR